MAAQFFKALGYEDGEFWYRSLSAICHGTAYGFSAISRWLMLKTLI